MIRKIIEEYKKILNGRLKWLWRDWQMEEIASVFIHSQYHLNDPQPFLLPCSISLHMFDMLGLLHIKRLLWCFHHSPCFQETPRNHSVAFKLIKLWMFRKKERSSTNSTCNNTAELQRRRRTLKWDSGEALLPPQGQIDVLCGVGDGSTWNREWKKSI